MKSFLEYYTTEDKNINLYTRYLRPVKTVFRSLLDGDLKREFRSKVTWYIEYELASRGVRRQLWFYKEKSVKTPQINTHNTRRRLARLRKVLRESIECDNYIEELIMERNYVL